jgi:putative holliday junction resolvase
MLASPYTIITRQKTEDDYCSILDIVAQYEVTCIVVGIPFNMDGTDGPQVVKTRAYGDELARRTDIPIVYQDERFSTIEAKRMVREARKPGRSERYDAAAAALILQDYLNIRFPLDLPRDEEDFYREA